MLISSSKRTIERPPSRKSSHLGTKGGLLLVDDEIRPTTMPAIFAAMAITATAVEMSSNLDISAGFSVSRRIGDGGGNSTRPSFPFRKP
jgi:hypothetical protein